MRTPQERLADALRRATFDHRARTRRITLTYRLMVATALLLGLALCLGGCPKPPGPGPVTPPDASDAAPAPPAPVVSCASACANVVNTLGCKVDSQTCLGICARVKRDSYRTCIAAAASCAAVDVCGRP